MAIAAILGFAGDTLTFVGGLILALDALGRDQEFRRQQQLWKAVVDLKGIELVKYGIKLTSDKSIEHVFIRQSVRRAFWGAAILALGFVFLFASRSVEAVTRTAEHCPCGT
jgi:hypothetical protein